MLELYRQVEDCMKKKFLAYCAGSETRISFCDLLGFCAENLFNMQRTYLVMTSPSQ